jgi:hypothetical protein
MILMKKKMALLIGGALIAQAMMAASASAEYVSENDVNIELNSSLLGDTFESFSGTGTTTFELQEGVHNELYQMSGAEVDHFYINLYVNGTHVLAVDPPLAMY